MKNPGLSIGVALGVATVPVTLALFAPPYRGVVAEPSNKAIAAAFNQISPSPKPSTRTESSSLQPLMATPTDNVIGRAIGAAEGNLNAKDGSKTSRYAGHVDPGNGVYNRGKFSNQFCNTDISLEECDRMQLNKIKVHWEKQIKPELDRLGVKPTQMEAINLMDVANQAPACVVNSDGSIANGSVMARLAEAYQKFPNTGDKEADKKAEWNRIQHARTWAYWNPDKERWDADGLRAYDDLGKETSIRKDVERRSLEILDAIEAMRKEQGREQPVSFNSRKTQDIKLIRAAKLVLGGAK